MADVKWIKIYTDMVSNKKIKRIRTLPEGNNIVLIWVFLLAQAGESNKGGALYLTDTIPFRIEDLAIEFDYEISVIQLALVTLERFSMIEVFEDIIYIKNWEEYQNIEGLDKIREQTRIRTIAYREKKKQLLLCDVTVTHGDATELELELELDIDKELDIDIEGNVTNNVTETVTILKPNELLIIQVLEKVKNYPLDREKEIDMYSRLTEKYPDLDIVSVIKEWSINKLDKPLKAKDSPRSQISKWCSNAAKWGQNPKQKPIKVEEKIRREKPLVWTQKN